MGKLEKFIFRERPGTLILLLPAWAIGFVYQSFWGSGYPLDSVGFMIAGASASFVNFCIGYLVTINRKTRASRVFWGTVAMVIFTGLAAYGS